jgi:hypothetical protein
MQTILSAKATAALSAKITESNSVQIEGLEKVCTVKELLTQLGTNRASTIRLNKKENPYFMTWSATGSFYLPLSKSLRAEHAKQPFVSITELLEYPVYMADVELEDGTQTTTFSIGIDQRKDIEDLNFAPAIKAATARR